VLSVSVDGVFDDAGQRYVAVRTVGGERYRIGEDRLRWAWRLVFTSEGRWLTTSAPVVLIVAEKARALRVACECCGRSGSALLFRTVQLGAEDVYFTRCRRCWRSRHLARFSRQRQLAHPAPGAPPPGKLSTKAAFAVAATLIGAILLGTFLVNHLG